MSQIKIKLDEICDFVNGGAWNQSEYTENGIPVLKVSNFNANSFSIENISYLSKKASNKYKKHVLKKNDLVIATVGSHQSLVNSAAGRTITINQDISGFYLNQNAVFLRSKNHEILDQIYLTYLGESESFRNYIQVRGKGAANQMRIAIGDIKSYPVTLPPLPTQQKIAKILSAYDDLIENNLKRIKRLEEMAQITYEEWFVRLKFPAHETTPINAETGLPEGWKKRDISELCLKITDGTHDSPKQVEDGIPLITGRHILGGFIDFNSAYLISEEDHKKIKKRSGLAQGDILFSNIGTLGNIGVVVQNFEYSCKNVVIFKKKLGFNNFLYTYLSNQNTKNKLDSQSSGVAQKFYSLKFIRALNEILPDNKLINDFDDVVAPIYKLKYQLGKQNQYLKEARDILLPRLMTGIIDVASLKVPKPLNNQRGNPQ